MRDVAVILLGVALVCVAVQSLAQHYTLREVRRRVLRLERMHAPQPERLMEGDRVPPRHPPLD